MKAFTANTFVPCARHHRDGFDYNCHGCLVRSLGRLAELLDEAFRPTRTDIRRDAVEEMKNRLKSTTIPCADVQVNNGSL
jgi:hypothetical protein